MWWRFALQIVSSKLQMCNTDTVSVFHSEAPQVTASEGLAQGPYVAARAGFEPMTLRAKVINSTNAPHTPNCGR